MLFRQFLLSLSPIYEDTNIAINWAWYWKIVLKRLLGKNRNWNLSCIISLLGAADDDVSMPALEADNPEEDEDKARMEEVD